jgi:hypothetical protein
METFPATASLAYNTFWYIIGAGLIFCVVLLILTSVIRSKPKAVITDGYPDTKATVPQTSSMITAATTKKYIESLQDQLDAPNPPPTQSIYAALSFIIRQFVDATHNTRTVNMSNEEVRHLAIDPSLTSIIDECYSVEFSPNHGSVEQCKALLKKAKEYIG